MFELPELPILNLEGVALNLLGLKVEIGTEDHCGVYVGADPLGGLLGSLLWGLGGGPLFLLGELLNGAAAPQGARRR